MRKNMFVTGAALLVAMTAATESQAQVFTPTYTSPRLVNEFGVNVSDYPGNLGVEGIWRGGPLGLRVGYANEDSGILSIGGEFRAPLQLSDAPLGLALTAAAQGLVAEQNAIGVQTGLTAGYTFMAPGIGVTPYIHPRVGYINDRGMDGFEFQALADVGVDAEFYNNMLVRVGVSLGELGSTWGVGVGFRR